MTPKYQVNRVIIDVDKMASGVPGMTPQEITNIYRDGRAASFLLDRTGAKIYGLKQAPMNAKGFDYVLGQFRGEFKCLTKGGVAFRRSKYTGVMRECDNEKVKESIARVEFYIIADVKEFPKVYFMKMTTGFVAQWHEKGYLGSETGQISWTKFYKVIGELQIEDWGAPKLEPV